MSTVSWQYNDTVHCFSCSFCITVNVSKHATCFKITAHACIISYQYLPLEEATHLDFFPNRSEGGFFLFPVLRLCGRCCVLLFLIRRRCTRVGPDVASYFVLFSLITVVFSLITVIFSSPVPEHTRHLNVVCTLPQFCRVRRFTYYFTVQILNCRLPRSFTLDITKVQVAWPT
jgi:hypothetical protein